MMSLKTRQDFIEDRRTHSHSPPTPQPLPWAQRKNTNNPLVLRLSHLVTGPEPVFRPNQIQCQGPGPASPTWEAEATGQHPAEAPGCLLPAELPLWSGW